jgi:hypothetical protein
MKRNKKTYKNPKKSESVIKFKLFFVGVLPLDELSLCIIEEYDIGNPDLGGRQADLL